MRTLLRKLKKSGDGLLFEKSPLEESKEIPANPGRGWYKIYSFFAEKKPDFSEVLKDGNTVDTLVLVIINIGGYRDGDIDEAGLKNIRSILSFFAERGYEIILRITYDHEGRAMEREPFFFTGVTDHLKQLTPILKEFQEHIFVYQGLLVGNWGEMHTSRFLHTSKLRELWRILKEEVGDSVFFAVRKPSYWRMLHPDKKKDSMGLFDDAIFGSPSHLGTFDNETGNALDWNAAWRKREELDFEDDLCRTVPNGGEVICGPHYIQCETSGSTIGTLRKMHITYLNRQYDMKLLELWRERNCNEGDLWKDSTLYDFITAHLGYRFLLQDVSMKADKKGERNLLKITVKNAGFAPIYRETKGVVIYQDTDGNEQIISTEYDLRALGSGEKETLMAILPLGAGKLYFRIPYGENCIFTGNKSMEDGRVYLGEVKA